MNKRALPIVCACFLLVAMTIQFIVSYGREKAELMDRMNYKMGLAQKDFIFEVYDMLEATEEIKHFYPEFDDNIAEVYALLETVLWHYPDLYCCYVTLLPEYSPQFGKHFSPCAFRVNADSVATYNAGSRIPVEDRDWYTGAMKSDDGGYWSLPYNDGVHADPVFTHSQKIYDSHDQLVGVAGADYSLAWTQTLLDDIKPYDDAICQLFSTDGTLIVSNGDTMGMRKMLSFEKVLFPTDMRLVISIPRYHLHKEIAGVSLITLSVLLAGILILGLLLNHIRREREAFTRVETANQLMEREMQIAHDIQMGILKGESGKVTGERGEGKEDVDLHAVLLPMREVGGDLYDFHREGDDLWFIIGDVSGKGVPAAMFMSAAVNLFRAAGMRASSPKEIMKEINAILSENNPSLTFVTAFIGCLHIPTGELLFCNAGHCIPVKVESGRLKVKDESGERKVESLTIEPNIPLGYDGRYCFVEQGCMLGEGDTLVLYTDGVTEARNERREMLGMEQWKEIIKSGKCEAEDLLGEVKSFIGTGEQADDITLMTIRKTSAVEPLVVRVENKMDHWPVLRCALHDYGVCVGMNARGLKKIELAVEEAVVNIINYSQAEWVELEVKVKSEKRKEDGKGKEINVTLRDNGAAFDPLQQAEVDTDRATDERQVGGMGIHLIRQIVDELHYERKENKNILRMVKSLNC